MTDEKLLQMERNNRLKARDAKNGVQAGRRAADWMMLRDRVLKRGLVPLEVGPKDKPDWSAP